MVQWRKAVPHGEGHSAAEALIAQVLTRDVVAAGLWLFLSRSYLLIPASLHVPALACHALL